jgi:hypothetical protein
MQVPAWHINKRLAKNLWRTNTTAYFCRSFGDKEKSFADVTKLFFFVTDKLSKRSSLFFSCFSHKENCFITSAQGRHSFVRLRQGQMFKSFVEPEPEGRWVERNPLLSLLLGPLRKIQGQLAGATTFDKMTLTIMALSITILSTYVIMTHCGLKFIVKSMTLFSLSRVFILLHRCLPVILSVRMSVCVCSSIYIWRSVCPSVCLSVSLFAVEERSDVLIHIIYWTFLNPYLH